MAVTTVTTTMAGAINYTHTTDTSADFASVANSTYFYNKADKIVRYKDSTGAVLEIFSASGGASGVFGIANTSGVYTYYTTLTLALTASVSGNTIEMFTDVIETGSVEITLKDGVNINGNGHTYTLNNTGIIQAFKTTASVNTSCNIVNLFVIRKGNTSVNLNEGCVFLFGTSSSGTINFNGSVFRNLGTGCAVYTSGTVQINNLTAYSKSANATIMIESDATFNNCTSYITGAGVAIKCQNGGKLQNCIGYAESGVGIVGLAGYQNNCIGIATTGNGFSAYNSAVNCVGRSISGTGFLGGYVNNFVNCIGISTSGTGLELTSGGINCTGISSSGNGCRIQYATYYNQTAKSSSNYPIFNTNGTTQLYNSTIISEWNNATGYGLIGNGAGNFPTVISKCTFILSNASAAYLFNSGANPVSMRGNTYKGGAAFATNITQAITAVEDSQGNIFL
jgi:hypothetical protein